MRDTVRQSTQDQLRAERSVETVFHIVGQAAAQIDATVEQSPNRAEQACAVGCGFCCYHPVDLTVPEALALVDELRHELSREAFDKLYQRLEWTADEVEALSFEAHAQARIPCALLVDQVCSVYSRRPFACRAWNSTCVNRCEEIFTTGDPVTMIPPLDMHVYEVSWGIARGVAQGIHAARLNGNTYELHSLLRRLLNTPDAAARWLCGEEVLAGCTVGAFTEGHNPSHTKNSAN